MKKQNSQIDDRFLRPKDIIGLNSRTDAASHITAKFVQWGGHANLFNMAFCSNDPFTGAGCTMLLKSTYSENTIYTPIQWR